MMTTVSAGIIVSWVEQDRAWAEWITYQLAERGFPVHLEYQPGSNRPVEFQRMLAAGYRVLAVVSPDSIVDDVVTGEWAIARTLDPTGAARRIVPVVVRPCDAGLLAPLVPLRLHGVQADAAPADLLLTALGLLEPPLRAAEFPGLSPGEETSLRQVDELIKQPPAQRREVLVASSDALPRLRVLTERARTEAASVGSGAHLRDDFGTGLYVVRDIETGLLAALRSGERTPQVVVGEPGAGKTSLLWGLATRLLERDDHEVFLVKATWLRAAPDQPALVDAAMIESAVAAAGRAATLMVDTADLVVNTEEGQLALVAAVRAATDNGASVVVTSRPAETQLLPGAWARVSLRHYDTTSLAGAPSEFERAVASHSRFYCRSAESSRQMAARMISAVARRQPLGQLCLRPLTLRLLFQLYAPSTVSDDVDVTGLYDAYWRDRVCRDRRVWAPDIASRDGDVDLSATVRSLAVAMLRAGNPEISLENSFDPGEAGRLRDDVHQLVRRGVGEIVEGVRGAAFRFFHQTFFEFAAAQALLHARGTDALALLEQRVRQRPDDFMLIAVFEQTWLCAWRDEDMAPVVDRSTLRLLEELLTQIRAEDVTEETLPYALQQTLLAVLAQSSGISPECRSKLGDVLAVASLPLVRDCLALMPPPQRSWTEADLDVVMRCAARADAAWESVLDVLSRLIQRDRRLAATAVRRLRPSALAGRAPTNDFFAVVGLPQLLGEVLLVDPAFALGELVELGRSAGREAMHNYVVTILRTVFDRSDELTEIDLASWSDNVVDTTDRKQAVITAHANVHRVAAVQRAKRAGWAALVQELTDLAEAVATAPRVTAPVGARFGGVLAALATEGPAELASAVDQVLGARSEPQLHAEIHRGWLVGYTHRAPNPMIEAWVERLADGLPASHRDPGTPAERWADTIRRTLERPDSDPETAAHVAAVVVDRRDGDAVGQWLDPDVFLRLLIRSASVGEPDALTALRRIRSGLGLRPDGLRTFLQQAARQLDLSPVEELLVRDTLVDRGEWGYLCQFLDHHPDHPLDDRANDLLTRVTADLTSNRIITRRDAARVLLALVRRHAVEPPPWLTLVRWFGAATDTAVRASLIEVMGAGLDDGQYQVETVRSALAPLRNQLLDGDRSSDVLAARTQLVVAIATMGSSSERDELLSLAFHEPIEAPVLARVSSFVRSAHRRRAADPGVPDASFLVAFGRRLAGTPRRTRKNTAVRWRPAIAEVLANATVNETLVVLDAIVDMDELFAASIALQLEPWRHPAIRDRMTELLDSPRAHPVLRRNVRMSLAKKTGHLTRDGWPTLPELLAEVGSREPVQ